MNINSPLIWVWASETRYIYDGMRVIQERNSGNTPQVSYTRGTDLSGSLEGAGGIGGLLARSHGYAGTNGNWYTHNFYHADGNGNITYLLNSSQSKAAEYRYDPFGNTISSSGTLASANVYRFSSKEYYSFYSANTIYYYGYRWYDPSLQRWPNRDPLGEVGGLNLYGFVHNDPVDRYDPDGLMDSVTLWILACIRAGNDPATCFCVAAPDEKECKESIGACLNALAKGLPNPKTGKPGGLPSPKDLCKCACEQAFEPGKGRDDCNKACDNLPQPKCKDKPEKPLPDISIPHPPSKGPPPNPPLHRRK